jgi:hypothetical protein
MITRRSVSTGDEVPTEPPSISAGEPFAASSSRTGTSTVRVITFYRDARPRRKRVLCAGGGAGGHAGYDAPRMFRLRGPQTPGRWIATVLVLLAFGFLLARYIIAPT